MTRLKASHNPRQNAARLYHRAPLKVAWVLAPTNRSPLHHLPPFRPFRPGYIADPSRVGHKAQPRHPAKTLPARSSPRPASPPKSKRSVHAPSSPILAPSLTTGSSRRAFPIPGPVHGPSRCHGLSPQNLPRGQIWSIEQMFIYARLRPRPRTHHARTERRQYVHPLFDNLNKPTRLNAHRRDPTLRYRCAQTPSSGHRRCAECQWRLVRIYAQTRRERAA